MSRQYARNGRLCPLVTIRWDVRWSAGLVCGLILGDVRTGILVGAAMQLLYIALVTPGGTVSADVRAVSYIGIPLAMLALKSYGMGCRKR